MLTTVAPYLDLFRAEREAPDVVEAVRRYDPNLAIVWNSASGRWIVCRGNERGLHPQFVYQGEDGRYLPLDARLPVLLASADRWRTSPNAGVHAQREASDLQKRQEKEEQEFHEEMDYTTREHRVTLNRLGSLYRDLIG